MSSSRDIQETTSPSVDKEPFVVAWPAAERQLLDDEGFEDLTHSSIITSSMLLEHEHTHDNLLDALSRLQEERARNERLRCQVDVARALASMPDVSDTPSRAVTRVAASWRGHEARAQVKPLLAAQRATEQTAAATLQKFTRRYQRSLTDPAQGHALRKELLRLHGAHAAALAEVAKKDKLLDDAVDRSIEAHHAHKAVLEAQEARAAQAEARAAELEARHATRAEQAAARLAELEALSTRLALEKAELAREVDEQRFNARTLEERLSELELQKDEAEENASRLLAEKLQYNESWGKPEGCAASLWGALGGASSGEDEDKGEPSAAAALLSPSPRSPGGQGETSPPSETLRMERGS